jgi:hypothetical protein
VAIQELTEARRENDMDKNPNSPITVSTNFQLTFKNSY